MMEDKLDNVVEFRPRNREKVDGHLLDLGTMAVEELVLLERQCVERYEDAHLELLVVQDALGRRRMRGEV